MSHNHPPHIPHPPYPPIPDPDNPNAPYVDVGQFKPFRAWSSRVIHDHGLERKAYKGQVLPDIMTFGSIALGSVSASQSVVVTNVGFRPLPIVDVVGVGDFIVTTNCPIGGNLPPGEACIVSVTFAPQRLGNQSGGVYVNTGNAAGTEFVQLLGSGIDGGGGARQRRRAHQADLPQARRSRGSPERIAGPEAGDQRSHALRDAPQCGAWLGG